MILALHGRLMLLRRLSTSDDVPKTILREILSLELCLDEVLSIYIGHMYINVIITNHKIMIIKYVQLSVQKYNSIQSYNQASQGMLVSS